MIRWVPLAGSISATVVATALFALGYIALSTVGLIIAFVALGITAYLSLIVEQTPATRLAVVTFLAYAAGMGALTAPAMFGYERIRFPGRILAGLLLGLMVALLWEFYVFSSLSDDLLPDDDEL